MIKQMVAALTTVVALGAANADTVITGGSDRPGATPGFAGTFYHVPAHSTNFTLADTLTTLATATPTGTFVSSSIDYSNQDLDSVTTFLDYDAPTYVGPSAGGDLSDAIFTFKGFIRIAAPTSVTFDLYHDDSVRLIIGDQTLITGGCCGTTSAVATFTTRGLYAVDLVYANTEFQNGGGGAGVTLGVTGNSITGYYQDPGPVPEPAAWAMFIAGFGLIGGALRRRSAGTVAA